VYSAFSQREYSLLRCPDCQFVFVDAPRTDFEVIYDAAYYEGRGADPLVDYVYEALHPSETVRKYEWRGILRVVGGLVSLGPSTRWLDYGAGVGSFVAYLRESAMLNAVAFEPSGGKSGSLDVPWLDEASLPGSFGTFDVVSAIEILEHAVDPIRELRQMRRLLRPGGLLFLTTGNARPFRGRIERWKYVMPDVHVSYFEPDNLASAMGMSGFRCEFPRYRPGWDDIIRYKVLKSLGCKRRNRVEALLPWPVLSRLIDRRLSVTAHPIGWAD
jgi:SAM-dependent methyltransferase